MANEKRVLGAEETRMLRELSESTAAQCVNYSQDGLGRDAILFSLMSAAFVLAEAEEGQGTRGLDGDKQYLNRFHGSLTSWNAQEGDEWNDLLNPELLTIWDTN